ncbi:MAG: methyltransferase domain-containing protein [Myxococcota bacterium]|nr:methyltransferase domain-containing protein [Myxococcota bacterium]
MKNQVKKLIQDSGIRFEVLQEIRHECHLVGLRLRQRFAPSHRRTASKLREMTEVKLHFGCGSRILPGWVNLDAYPCEGISLEFDLQGELPLADNSVRWIFTEHVLEHIDRKRIGGIFSEFHRVLALGGVARILVPDLSFYCQTYTEGDVETITTPLPHTHTTADAVNSVFNEHFHRFIYDFETMKLELEKAGFTDIVCCEYGQTTHPILALDSNEKSRIFGTLCVEATRT